MQPSLLSSVLRFLFCGVFLSMLRMLFLKMSIKRNLNLSLACPCSSAMSFVNVPTLQNVCISLQRCNGLIICDADLKIAFHTVHAKFLVTSESPLGKHDKVGERMAVHNSV